MELSVPTKRVYYFEITPRSQRLIYHIPANEVRTLVDQRKIDRRVLGDYPFGLEIEVSDSSFRLVQDDYGFVLPLSPKLIWIAFRGLYLSWRRRNDHSESQTIDPREVEPYAGSGMIDARKLDAYARKLRPAAAEIDQEVRRSGASEAQEGPARRQIELTSVFSRIRDDVLSRYSAPQGNPELPFDKQFWCKVPMSRGATAGELFSTVQTVPRRGEHAGES